MKLADYLAEEDISPNKFGAKIGVTGQAVRNWSRGLAVPNRTTMPKIIKETGGKVMPADFWENLRILSKVS